MKRSFFMHAIYALLLCTVFVSCSSDDTNELPKEPNGKRMVSTITIKDPNEGWESIMHFDYNKDGLISKLEIFYDEVENDIINVTYETNKVTADLKSEYIDYNGKLTFDLSTYVAILRDGKIVRINEEDGPIIVVKYENDRISSIVEQSGRYTSIFDWTDGNLNLVDWTASSTFHEKYIMKYTPYSTENINLDLNYLIYYGEGIEFAVLERELNPIFLSQNLMGIGNKTLVRSLVAESSMSPMKVSYDYELDAQGSPVFIRVSSGGSIEEYQITYLN